MAGLAAVLLLGWLLWLLARRYRRKIERDLTEMIALRALFAAETAARDCQYLTDEEMTMTERRSVALSRIEELMPRTPILWLDNVLDDAAAQVKAVYPSMRAGQDR